MNTLSNCFINLLSINFVAAGCFCILLLALQLYFFYLDNRCYSFSYEEKKYVNERHKNENRKVHMAGLFIFSIVFIFYKLLDSIRLSKISGFVERHNSQVVKDFISNNFIDTKNISLLMINNLRTISCVFFITILICGVYFTSKNIHLAKREREELAALNKDCLNENDLKTRTKVQSIFKKICFFTPVLGMVITLPLILEILSLNFFPSAIVTKSTFSVEVWTSLYELKYEILFCFLFPLLAYGLLGFLQWRVNKQKDIQRQKSTIKVFLILTIVLFSVLFFSSYLSSLFLYGQFSSISKSNFIKLFKFASFDYVFLIFPLLFGGVDDISKIDSRIINLSDKLKFFILGFLGILVLPTQSTIYYGTLDILQKFFNKFGYIFHFIWLAIALILKALLFTTSICAFNFTDGADGLLFVSTMGFLVTSCGLIFHRATILFNMVLRTYEYEEDSIFYMVSFLNSLDFFFLGYFILFFIICYIIFFLFNKKPAKLILGESGSFGVGCTLFLIMLKTGFDIHLLLSCVMCYWQVITTTIQMTSYKLYGRKVFLMAPFHHHLERLNYSDQFILGVYGLTNTTLALLSTLLLLCQPFYVESFLNIIAKAFNV